MRNQIRLPGSTIVYTVSDPRDGRVSPVSKKMTNHYSNWERRLSVTVRIVVFIMMKQFYFRYFLFKSKPTIPIGRSYTRIHHVAHNERSGFYIPCDCHVFFQKLLANLQLRRAIGA